MLLGAGLVLAVSGCGVRLEDDAPDIPLVPRRTPIAGEAALLAMVTSLSQESDTDSVPAGAAGDRVETFVDALTELRVPETEIRRARDADLTWTEAEDVAVYEGALRECQPGLLPLVGSLATTRVLRGPADLWTEGDPSAWQGTDPARSAAQDTRAAIWSLTVVAARADGDERSAVQAVVAGLQKLLSRQVVAGDDDGSTAPLGYDLEEGMATADERATLVRETLSTLAARYLALLPALVDDRDAAHEVVAWAAAPLGLGGPWQVEVESLPGLEG